MAKQRIKVIREEMLQVASNVAQEKNINQDDVFSAMEQALEKSARVKYGMERDIRVNIDRDTGDIRLETYLKVVENHSEEEQAREILLTEAQKIQKDIKVDEYIVIDSNGFVIAVGEVESQNIDFTSVGGEILTNFVTGDNPNFVLKIKSATGLID